MRKQQREKLEAACKAFNEKFPVGSPVIRYRLVEPLREPMETRTRSEAWVIESGAVIVKVEGVAGGVVIGSIEPRPEPVVAGVGGA